MPYKIIKEEPTMRKMVSLLLALMMIICAIPAMAEDVYTIDCYWVGNGDNTAVREGVEKVKFS